MSIIKKILSVKNALGLALVGVLFMAVSVLLLTKVDNSGYIKTEAEILRIEESGSGEEKEYHVFVRYAVNGDVYERELPAYDSSWKVGDTVKCTYKADDPGDLRSGDPLLWALLSGIAGIAAFVFGILAGLKALKKPTKDYNEHDRVDLSRADAAEQEALFRNAEVYEPYVIHFTGRMNQDYIMKDADQAPVFEALCEKVQLVKDTAYDFVDHTNGTTVRRMVGHTLTRSIGAGEGFTFRMPITSGFNLDGVYVWDYLAEQGYGFDFSMRGLSCVFSVKHWGVPVGEIVTAGSGVMNEKYKDNPLGKVPANGIYTVSCRPSEAEMIFLIAFTLARVELF